MKHLYLTFIFSLTLLTVFAQTQVCESFTARHSLPPDWFTGGGAQVTGYENPSASCNADFGLQTPGVGGANPARLIQASTSSTGTTTIEVSFDIFAFDANLNCLSSKPFPCATWVTVYLVRESYTDVHHLPPPSEIYAESEHLLSTGNNVIVLDASAIPTGVKFRIMFDFKTVGSECIQGNTKYVIDNVCYTQRPRCNTPDCIGEIPTPVQWREFKAVRNSGLVHLNWTTASEENNRGFNIQRNLRGVWESVAFVPSAADAGNSSSTLSYSYTDANTARGVSQYRIQQTDFDGKSKYSEIRSVRGQEMSSRLLVYPNPSTTGTISLVYEDQVNRDVQVMDLSGRIVRHMKNMQSGASIYGLENGVYSVRISGADGRAIIEKIIVKKQ